MTPVFSRHRYVLGGILALMLLAAVLIQTVPFAHMAWGALTGGPGMGLVPDMRQALLNQETFRAALAEHEEEALARYRRGHSGASSEDSLGGSQGVSRGGSSGAPSAYQRRRLIRVNLTPLGLPGFHDVFAVRMRTTVLPDTAYTSFLARPGVVFSSGDIPFFSRQCESSVCRALVRNAVGAGRSLMRWGLITPFRLNITEMDATSSVSIGREPISTGEWGGRTAQLHRRGTGRSFRTNPHRTNPQ